jgi:hypothetical protein
VLGGALVAAHVGVKHPDVGIQHPTPLASAGLDPAYELPIGDGPWRSEPLDVGEADRRHSRVVASHFMHNISGLRRPVLFYHNLKR